jgi:hypothetical protein
LGFTSFEDCCDPLYLWVISSDLRVSAQVVLKLYFIPLQIMRSQLS